MFISVLMDINRFLMEPVFDINGLLAVINGD